MAISDIGALKEQLSFTADLGATDDVLLQRKLDAAQNHIERLLGFKIEVTFGGAAQEPVPPALVEAVLMLAASWYENREAVGEAGREMPFGVAELVREYRNWSF